MNRSIDCRFPSGLLLGTLLMGLATTLACQQQDRLQTADSRPPTTKSDASGDRNWAETSTADSQLLAATPSTKIAESIDAGNDSSTRSQLPQAISLFDGKTLAGWQVTPFGSEGDCGVEDGLLVISAGFPMSGVTSTRDDLPTTDYEISLEVRRTMGSDFFCGLTFPVAASHCTLIVGGWSGPVVGLSCIDDLDAVNNESLRFMKFETDQWYRIKVRVVPQRIQAWIDDELLVDQDIEGRRISVRSETLPTRPLGICNFETSSQFKNMQLRHLNIAP